METEVVKVVGSAEDIDSLCSLEKAGKLIREGQVVAFPTETVYGLGGNALNKDAVRKIFEAKGRPGDNPLIVHISDISQLEELVSEVPDRALALAGAFWPGPLTLILKKKPIIPTEVTAGLDTVGIRMPSNPVAHTFIKCAKVPIAAPSANRSGYPSPTTAEHVYSDMSGRIPLILDGGVSNIGVESTVLDITSKVPVILRPGGITKEMLTQIIGKVDTDPSILAPVEEGQKVRSPGMKYKHYSPKAEVIVYKGTLDKLVEAINNETERLSTRGKKIGVLATDETVDSYSNAILLSMGSRSKPKDIASSLFSLLREFDRLGVDIILAESVDTHDEGLAVMNRMLRAAAFRVKEV